MEKLIPSPLFLITHGNQLFRLENTLHCITNTSLMGGWRSSLVCVCLGVKSTAYAQHISGDPAKKNCSSSAAVLIKRNAGVQAVIAKVFNQGSRT